MADPQHTPQMSVLDNFTVILYRIGIVIIAISSILFIVESLLLKHILGNYYLPVFAIGAALASANVHLYDARFRWFIPFMSWVGFILLAISYGVRSETGITAFIIETGSLGFFYAAAGMFAVKEQFCFKIPGLQLVPLFLAVSVFCRLFHFPMLEAIVLIPGALLLLILSIAKWRMPLHFDVGDKSKYTI